MTSKCTGIMGHIFGHKWTEFDRINNHFIMGYRLAWSVVIGAPKDIPERDQICLRCGAVEGENK